MKNKKILIIVVVLIMILIIFLINKLVIQKSNEFNIDKIEKNIEYKVNNEDTEKIDIYENGVITKTIEKEMIQFYKDNPDFDPQLPIDKK